MSIFYMGTSNLNRYCHLVNMHLTNVVVRGNLNCSVDLRVLTHQLNGVKYDPAKFSGLVYQQGSSVA